MRSRESSLFYRPSHPPDRPALERLSNNLRWSWHKPTQDLFATIDEPWQQVGQDPIALLGASARNAWTRLAVDDGLLNRNTIRRVIWTTT